MATRTVSRSLAMLLALLWCLPFVQGCGGGGEKKPSGETAEGGPEAEKQPLLLPFDPPALEALDAKVTWVDRPVVDALQDLREYYADQQPLVTVAEALQIKNTSAEANAKIISALGRSSSEDGAEVDFDAVITRSLDQDLRSLNPLLQSSTSEQDIAGLTGFGLFGFDWKLQPHAAAEYVKSWQSSEDGLYDKVIMREDIRWSDGQPITAHDVAFSFKTIMDERIPIPAVRSGTDELRWVEAYDDHTLVYFQKESRATNAWNLNFPVLPKHIYEQTIPDDYTLVKSLRHVELEERPVTGGIYEVAKRTLGSDIVLRLRESYYMVDGKQVRPKPLVREYRYKIIEDANTRRLALEIGDLDECELQAQQWVTQTGSDDFYELNTKVSSQEWTFFYFGWNFNTPYFSDKRVRQAMSHAFDHQEMLDTLCYGLYQPCYGIFHPDSWMFPKNPAQQPGRYNKFDLDRAEDLLDEAGWDDSDGDGVRDKVIDGTLTPFEFSIIVSNKPDRKAICELLRENLEQIGVVCNVKSLEAATMQEFMFKRTYEACMAGWGAGADPYTNENLFATGEGRNYGSYSNSDVDGWFKAGMLEFDREKRAEIYGKIYQQVYEDQVYTFLYYQSAFYGFSKRLRGYHFSPRGPFHYSPGLLSIYVPQR